MAGYASLTGNVLTMNPPDGYVGIFGEEVLVSDGALSYKRIFWVTAPS